MKNKIEVFWGKTTVGTSGGCYLESMWWEEKVQVTLEELEKSLKTDKTSEKKKTKKIEKKVKSTEKSAEGRAGE